MRVHQDTVQKLGSLHVARVERYTRHIKLPATGKWAPDLPGASATSRYCPLNFFGVNPAHGHAANANGREVPSIVRMFGSCAVRFKKRTSYTFWALFGYLR